MCIVIADGSCLWLLVHVLGTEDKRANMDTAYVIWNTNLQSFNFSVEIQEEILAWASLFQDPNYECVESTYCGSYHWEVHHRKAEGRNCQIRVTNG